MNIVKTEKAHGKESTAVKPVLEVNLTEDALLDTASEVTGNMVIPNINIMDNFGNFGSLTDELSFNLNSKILSPKPFTGTTPKTTIKAEDTTPSLPVSSDEVDDDSGEDGDESEIDSQASRNTKDDSEHKEGRRAPSRGS